MMILYGTRLFGKVDRVPGLCHVATKFFHINFIPLVPGETWLVIAEGGGAWRGVEIPFSRKSAGVAWLRGGMILAALATFIAAVWLGGIGRQTAALVMAAWCVVAVATVIGSYFIPWIWRASPQRIDELAPWLGLSDEDVAAITQHSLGRPTGFPITPRTPAGASRPAGTDPDPTGDW